MNEARRFLRYVTPGLIFCTEILILFWIIETDLLFLVIKGYDNSGLGLAVATLIASGGVGFLFSMVHHSFHWTFDQNVANYNRLIYFLYTEDLFRLKDIESGKDIKVDKNIDGIIELVTEEEDDKKDAPSLSAPLRQFKAWMIMDGLWRGCVNRGAISQTVDQRVSSLADLFHSLGTARIATGASLICTNIIPFQNCYPHCHNWPVVRIIVGILFTLFIFILCEEAYRRSGRAVQLITEKVLYDALNKKKKRAADNWLLISTDELNNRHFTDQQSPFRSFLVGSTRKYN